MRMAQDDRDRPVRSTNEPPPPSMEKLQFLLVVLLDGGAVADADDDGVGQPGSQHLVHLELQAFVEGRCRLVEEDRLGFGEQDTGERDPLLLAGHSTLAQSCTSLRRMIKWPSATSASVRWRSVSGVPPGSAGYDTTARRSPSGTYGSCDRNIVSFASSGRRNVPEQYGHS